MYSSDEEEEKIDDLWSFKPKLEEDTKSEEQRREEAQTRKKLRQILETMYENLT